MDHPHESACVTLGNDALLLRRMLLAALVPLRWHAERVDYAPRAAAVARVQPIRLFWICVAVILGWRRRRLGEHGWERQRIQDRCKH